jgi:hypothetical protein
MITTVFPILALAIDEKQLFSYGKVVVDRKASEKGDRPRESDAN